MISIGMVKETGETYYAICSEFNPENAHEWVKKNVIAHLEPELPRLSMAEIRGGIVDFIGKDKPEMWAYYASYDWVAFCWIFGNMRDMPPNFPRFCLDLRQAMFHKGLDNAWRRRHCPPPEGEHNALVDAQWNMRLHAAIEAAPANP
ncbi:MAG: 3'-5' exoribonuclease [Bacteroidota bacterium]